MAQSKITTKGQCVVPKKIRDYMRLNSGSRIRTSFGRVLPIIETKGAILPVTSSGVSAIKLDAGKR